MERAPFLAFGNAPSTGNSHPQGMLCSPALPLLRVKAFRWAQDSSRSSAPGAMSVSLPSGSASPLFSIYDFPGQEVGMGASHCSTSVTPLAGTHDSTVSPGAGGSPSWSSATNRSLIQQCRKQAPRKSRLLLLPIDTSGFSGSKTIAELSVESFFLLHCDSCYFFAFSKADFWPLLGSQLAGRGAMLSVCYRHFPTA